MVSKPVTSAHCCQMWTWMHLKVFWQIFEDGLWKDRISVSVPALWHPAAVYASPVLSSRPGQSWNLWKSHWNGVFSCLDTMWGQKWLHCFAWFVFSTHVFWNTGQVTESHMWGSELAHWLWGEKKTGDSCFAAERRSGPFFCCSVLQLFRWARLDHRFRSEKSRAGLGVKVKGKDVLFRQHWLSKPDLRILHQDEELKRQKREERLEMIRGNVQLKYAMKRKVSNPAQRQPYI